MTAPRRSYLVGYRLGALLRLIPFGIALASWGGLWLLLLVGLLTRGQRSEPRLR